ncbi:MAG: ribosome-associated translation inhibitor RaiA [Sulfuricurvum sp.]|jgi:putative sigma-54 modulation protein
MPLQIYSKEISLTPEIKSHIEAAIGSFNKYSLEITSTKVDIKKQKNGISAEFDVRVAHSEPVIITQEHDDLYAAIDLAVDRVTKALRRLHDKIVTQKGSASIKDQIIEE